MFRMRGIPLCSTKAGEFQGSMQFGNGLDLQGAVSITNHIGLMANYSYADRNTNSYDPDYEDTYHHHKFFEGGIGYYENDGNWCYEVFAGYGQRRRCKLSMSTHGGGHNRQGYRKV